MSKATASKTAYIGNANLTKVECITGIFVTSDARFKENVSVIKFIEQLRPVTYNYDLKAYNEHAGISLEVDSSISEASKEAWLAQQNKQEKVVRTGFIAQEVAAAARSVKYDFSGVATLQTENGHYAVNYSEFVVPLVKATQEQQEEIENLKHEIKKLKKLIVDIANDRSSLNDQTDKTESPVSCFPNPTEGSVNLVVKNSKNGTMEIFIFDASGRLYF